MTTQSAAPAVTVIIRAKDKADTISATIASVRAQSVLAEVVVVDSGSVDGTLEIARRLADTVLEIPASSFTYGDALNRGAAVARAQVHVALSAHCTLPSPRWLERVVELHADPRVAGTSGEACDWHGAPLRAPVFQRSGDGSEASPYWGYSNHAGSWAASAWASHPFDPTLGASEDKEWSSRVRRNGYVIALTPELIVGASHRRREGLRLLFRRAVRESAAMSTAGLLTPRGVGAATRAYLRDVERSRSVTRQRLNPYRLTEHVGRYIGERFPDTSRYIG